MPSQKNIDEVKVLTDKLETASAVYFTDYLGLDVESITNLRSEFFHASVEFRVTKNTLLKFIFCLLFFVCIGLFALAAIAEIRKHKTAAKQSIAAEVAICTLSDTPERLDLLRPALSDVASAARAAEITLVDGASLTVEVELAPINT